MKIIVNENHDHYHIRVNDNFANFDKSIFLYSFDRVKKELISWGFNFTEFQCEKDSAVKKTNGYYSGIKLQRYLLNISKKML